MHLLTQGTGLGRSSGKVILGWFIAPFEPFWSLNNCNKAPQTLKQFKARFWYPYFFSPLDYAVSLSREGEWQMSGRSWEHPDTLNLWNDPRFCWFCLHEQFLFEEGLVWPRVTSWPALAAALGNKSLEITEIALLVSVAQERSQGGVAQKRAGKGFGAQSIPAAVGRGMILSHRGWTL